MSTGVTWGKSKIGFSTFTVLPSAMTTRLEQKGCQCTKFDRCVTGILLAALLFLAILAIVLSDNGVPDDINNLPIGESVPLELFDVDDAVFIRGEVNEEDVVCFTTLSNQTELDTTIALLNNNGLVLQFNDNIALENEDSLLCHSGAVTRDPIVEVRTRRGAGEFELFSIKVENEVVVGELFETNIREGEIFFAFVNLAEGAIYEVIAFSRDLFGIDSAIKIRSIEGEELTEAFQSTITELTARTLFVAPISGRFILEVRQIVVLFEEIDLNVLFSRRQSQPLDLLEGPEVVNSFVSDIKSTIFEFRIPPFTSVDFSFEINEELIVDLPVDLNILFFFTEPYNPEVLLMLSSVMPALSFRVYDKDSNFVIKRARSEVSLENVTALNDTSTLFTAVFSHISSDFSVDNADEESLLLLDISRWHPNFEIIDNNTVFVESSELFDFNFTFQLRANNIVPGLADEFNLFPDCAIDPAKHIFDDDTCDQGIVLFCRNEFFPNANIEQALLSDFADVCTCTEFLCSALISGTDIGQNFFGYYLFLAGLTIFISCIAIIIYSIAIFDIAYFGGLGYWIRISNAFKTWTLCILFFFFSIIYSATRISLSRYSSALFKIDDNFDLATIPTPADSLSYRYYEANFDLRNDFVGLDYDEYGNEGDELFLDNVSLNQVSGISFDEIRRNFIVNFASSSLKNFLAVVIFLDISLVWIRSVKTKTLNKSEQNRRIKSFERFVLSLEFIFFLMVLGLVIDLGLSDGTNYSILPSLMIFLVSLLVMFTYILGRIRLHYHLVQSNFASGKHEYNVWLRIQRTSSVVIACCAAVVIIQIYFMIRIRSFDDLLSVGNDIFALNMFLFQDICITTGQVAIFIYLLLAYFDYKTTLFVDEEPPKEVLSDDIEELNTNFLDTPSKVESSGYESVTEIL